MAPRQTLHRKAEDAWTWNIKVQWKMNTSNKSRGAYGMNDHGDDGDDLDIHFSFGSWWAVICPRSKSIAPMAAPYTITRSRSRECINGSRSYASQPKPRVERRNLKRTQCHVCQSHSITHLRKRMLCRSSPQERKKRRKRLDGRRPPSP